MEKNGDLNIGEQKGGEATSFLSKVKTFVSDIHITKKEDVAPELRSADAQEKWLREEANNKGSDVGIGR